jgi:hypothetical protein
MKDFSNERSKEKSEARGKFFFGRKEGERKGQWTTKYRLDLMSCPSVQKMRFNKIKFIYRFVKNLLKAIL